MHPACPEPAASPRRPRGQDVPPPLSTFGTALAGGPPEIRRGVAVGADAQTLRTLFAAANTETRWGSGGRTDVLRVRPLLPHETGCDDPIV
jgi:hypothetical protein